MKWKKRPRRYRKTVPDQPGWWWWKEDGASPVCLLIVCCRNHSEVASDAELEKAHGRSLDELFSENYWEGTDTSTMPGLWMFQRPEPTLNK